VAAIPNPVDLDRFSPGRKPPELLRAHAIDPRHVVVAHLSNLGPLKRPMDVVESAALVLTADPNVVYLIVGEGPCRVPMEARCRELGIAGRVRFVGWIEHAEIPAYLRLSDLVVMSSEHEGLPLVYLEAQASGKLLVASDIPATREVVVDGETGLVFRRGDIADLAAKTLRGAADDALREATGRAARTAVRAHATPDILAAYARLLEELVASSPGARHVDVRDGTEAVWALTDRLEADLWALVEAQGGRLVAATPIGTLASHGPGRAAFRLRFDDGRVLKGRRVDHESTAARVSRLSPLLDPRHFPRVLAHRGVALLSEWAEGVPGAAGESSTELCRRAGVLLGALHRTPVPAEDVRQGQERWSRWPDRLQRDLDRLVARRAVDPATGALAMAAAKAAAPAGIAFGLVHGDLCLENIVCHEGEIRVVDTEDLRVYACDYDLARTWYRWPMTAPERQAFYDGYHEHRDSRGFLDHFAHWAVIVLVESAAFRLRACTGDPDQPLGRLRALLASEMASPPPRPETVPAGPSLT
jgi:hypothetical protein